jgi:hypothetical protein
MLMDDKFAKGKPTLHLLNPRTMPFESFVGFSRNLTGRAPTETEMAELREEWDLIEQERVRRNPSS